MPQVPNTKVWITKTFLADYNNAIKEIKDPSFFWIHHYAAQCAWIHHYATQCARILVKRAKQSKSNVEVVRDFLIRETVK